MVVTKFKDLEPLQERVRDLSESERNTQETANAIQKTLLGIVQEKNKKANAYEKDVNNFVEKQVIKRDNRQAEQEAMKKYGTTKMDMKKIIEHKTQYTQEEYKKLEKQVRLEHKTKGDIKKDIFAIIKRAYNKNVTLHEGSDIDKDASLFLLKITGFFKNSKGEKLELKNIIKEVPNEHIGEKGVTIDNGGTVSGIKINNIHKGNKHRSLIGSQAIISEHSDGSLEAEKTGRTTSSAHMLHYILDKLQQIPDQYRQQMQRFINFIDIVDSLDYQASGMDYTNSYRTLFGLHRNLQIEEIYQYFEDPKHTGFEILSEDFLNQHNATKHYRKGGKPLTEEVSLKEISNKQKERVERNIKQITEMDTKGQFGLFKGDKGGERFYIALGDEISDGAQVASYYEAGLIKIFPSGDFYLFSQEELANKVLNFTTDGHFLIIKNISKEDLQRILDIFYINEKHSEEIKARIMAYREKITPRVKDIGNIEDLKDIALDQLKIGETYEGVVHNVNGKHIYVNITPNIVGLIKGEKKEKELSEQEKIKVRITNISTGENGKTAISLEKAA
ncbi:MAG: hypothetical protein NTY80_03150 [candidate division SR1 bacterium]|nr:hypothetical protein [candidate division SR1 bacterium]